MAKLDTIQKIAIAGVLAVGGYLLLTIYRYWSADTLYARAKAEIELGRIGAAVTDLTAAINKTPGEPLYHDKLAQVYAAVAAASSQQKDATSAAELTTLAISQAETALALSPKNFVVLQDRVNIYSDLATIDPNYRLESIKTLEYLTAYAPTYAKIYYKLGIGYLSIGQKEKAKQNLQKAVDLKSNYDEAQKALETLASQKSP